MFRSGRDPVETFKSRDCKIQEWGVKNGESRMESQEWGVDNGGHESVRLLHYSTTGFGMLRAVLVRARLHLYISVLVPTSDLPKTANRYLDTRNRTNQVLYSCQISVSWVQ